MYAWAVASGSVPAGKWHRLSCERHIRDLVDAAAGIGEYVFRPDLAARVFGLFRLFRHYKGSEWAGRPIELQPFQQFIIGSIFGWVWRSTGKRRFRNSFIELTRGNGKSTIAGGCLVVGTFFDGEAGAEGYSVATKKDQARICFQAGRQMVLKSPAIKDHITVSKYNLHASATESKMEALGADADTLDGLRPHFAVADEVHKMPSPELIEVIESGMGTRDQPHLMEITTAGTDDNSIYGQHYLLSTRVLEGTVPLPEWFAFIASADPDDDWTQPDTWIKANPNYGVSVKPEFLQKELRKALANPSEQAKFRRLYLGQKLQAVEGYFSVADWRACPPLPEEAVLRRAPCWMGLDLSSSVDVTAAVLVWRLEGGEIAVKPYFWLPEDNLEERGHRDRVPYALWREQRYLSTTEGNVIDRPTIRKEIAALAKDWKIGALCYDPWHAQELIQNLKDEDHVLVEPIPQRYEQLSPAMKDLQALILRRRVRHDVNPLMDWMIGNVVPRGDEKDNVMPSKKRSRGRIDGVQALLNVMGKLMPVKPRAVGAFYA